jgi:hypothetical protein
MKITNTKSLSLQVSDKEHQEIKRLKIEPWSDRYESEFGLCLSLVDTTTHKNNNDHNNQEQIHIFVCNIRIFEKLNFIFHPTGGSKITGCWNQLIDNQVNNCFKNNFRGSISNDSIFLILPISFLHILSF